MLRKGEWQMHIFVAVRRRIVGEEENLNYGLRWRWEEVRWEQDDWPMIVWRDALRGDFELHDPTLRSSWSRCNHPYEPYLKSIVCCSRRGFKIQNMRPEKVSENCSTNQLINPDRPRCNFQGLTKVKENCSDRVTERDASNWDMVRMNSRKYYSKVWVTIGRNISKARLTLAMARRTRCLDFRV